MNEELLLRAGASWRSLAVAELQPDWLSSRFVDLIPSAVEHLNSRDEDVDRLGSELRELHETYSQALAVISSRW